jgi:hypothetical protein
MGSAWPFLQDFIRKELCISQASGVFGRKRNKGGMKIIIAFVERTSQRASSYCILFLQRVGDTHGGSTHVEIKL